MRKPRSYDGLQDLLETTARTYRRNLWQDVDAFVEVWVEKDALAGVILPVTTAFDVPLMISRGFTSETFAYECIDTYEGTNRPLIVYALYDFDRSGRDAAASLSEKLDRFGAELGVEVHFNLLGVNLDQIKAWNLLTRPHKRATTADRRWPHSFACELDAIAPDNLREMVAQAIERHMPEDELAHLLKIEAAERETLRHLILSAP
jgi:hypothetical protein